MSSGPAATLGTPAGYRRIGGRVNLLVHWRSLAVSGVAFVIILVGAVASLTTGTYPVSLDMLLAIFRGEGEELAAFMVLEQRLPRATGAIVIGGMLGMSGAIFQSVSRNPLGSPDIVGFTRGATTGGLLAILVLASSSTFVTGAGAIIGGAATAAVVVLLTLRRGVGGDTLVLTGIALGQMLASLNDYLLAATDIESAEAAKTWQHGSLNGITWGSVTPLLITAVLLLPVGLWLAGPGRILEMGDDAAAGLGLPVGDDRRGGGAGRRLRGRGRADRFPGPGCSPTGRKSVEFRRDQPAAVVHGGSGPAAPGRFHRGPAAEPLPDPGRPDQLSSRRSIPDVAARDGRPASRMR